MVPLTVKQSFAIYNLGLNEETDVRDRIPNAENKIYWNGIDITTGPRIWLNHLLSRVGNFLPDTATFLPTRKIRVGIARRSGFASTELLDGRERSTA